MPTTMSLRRGLAAGARLAAAAALLLGTAGDALAREVPVGNPRFDADVQLDHGQCVSMPQGWCDYGEDEPIPGWVVHGSSTGIFMPRDSTYDSIWTHGTVAFAWTTSHGPGWLQQEIGHASNQGTYTLQVRFACRLGVPCAGVHVVILYDGKANRVFDIPPQDIQIGV